MYWYLWQRTCSLIHSTVSPTIFYDTHDSMIYVYDTVKYKLLSLCQTFSFLRKSSWPTCAALIITVFSSAIISNTAFQIGFLEIGDPKLRISQPSFKATYQCYLAAYNRWFKCELIPKTLLREIHKSKIIRWWTSNL